MNGHNAHGRTGDGAQVILGERVRLGAEAAWVPARHGSLLVTPLGDISQKRAQRRPRLTVAAGVEEDSQRARVGHLVALHPERADQRERRHVAPELGETRVVRQRPESGV